jgi:hypothetical protein
MHGSKPTPKTLLGCFHNNDGTVNIDLYCQYLEYANEEYEKYKHRILSKEEAEAEEADVLIQNMVAWLIVNNGYLSWPTTIPPIKSTTDRRKFVGQNGWSQSGTMLNALSAS